MNGNLYKDRADEVYRLDHISEWAGWCGKGHSVANYTHIATGKRYSRLLRDFRRKFKKVGKNEKL